MATWPSALPLPTQQGYELTAGDGTIRTDMESGAARVRLRSRSAPLRAHLRCVFKVAEMATFQSFWESDMQEGAAWVFIPILDGTGASVSRECRALGPYRASILGFRIWSVDLQVEVRRA
jgi:hypothetical protein